MIVSKTPNFYFMITELENKFILILNSTHQSFENEFENKYDLCPKDLGKEEQESWWKTLVEAVEGNQIEFKDKTLTIFYYPMIGLNVNLIQLEMIETQNLVSFLLDSLISDRASKNSESIEDGEKKYAALASDYESLASQFIQREDLLFERFSEILNSNKEKIRELKDIYMDKTIDDDC